MKRGQKIRPCDAVQFAQLTTALRHSASGSRSSYRLSDGFSLMGKLPGQGFCQVHEWEDDGPRTLKTFSSAIRKLAKGMRRDAIPSIHLRPVQLIVADGGRISEGSARAKLDIPYWRKPARDSVSMVR